MSATDVRKGAPPTFSPAAVAAMLLVGVLAFLSLGVLAAYAPELRGGLGGGGDALSRSAVGYAGIVRLLRATGHPVVVSRGPAAPGAMRATAGLLVLTPPATAKARDVARLIAGERRTVLLVAPKWTAAPDVRHPGWVLEGDLNNLGQARSLLQGGAAGAVLDGMAGTAPLTLTGSQDLAGLAPLDTGPVRSPRTVSAPGALPLLVDADGHAILVRTTTGLLVLAEPDLLDNLGMADARTAATGVTLLRALGGDRGPVAFDVSLNGLGRPRSLLGLALAPPFLGATLCALAAALLMGAHALVRFGPAQGASRALALGKAALLDNSAILIGLARREPAMGRRYAAMVRRSLLHRAGAPGASSGSGEAAIDASLDRMNPGLQPPFALLAVDAERAHDNPALMRAVRALHQRQTEILGERS